jgi:cell division protein FtsZ
MFELEEVAGPGSDGNSTVIKVVGVGGAGGNAVDHMIREGVGGVEFICCNTDSQALKKSNAHVKLQLGPGLGAGGKPEKARELAMQERERIAEALRRRAHGLHHRRHGRRHRHRCRSGGRRGGARAGHPDRGRGDQALRVRGQAQAPGRRGRGELSRHVDSLIVILNEKLEEVLGDEVSMLEAFKAADNVLRNAVGGIAEIINVPGLVNVDFEDVRTVMGEMGKAMMGSAVAAGVDRARIAAEEAVASPLLEGIELSGRPRRAGQHHRQQYPGPQGVQGGDEDHPPIHGARGDGDLRRVFDEGMEDQLRVTVVATGLGIVARAKRQAGMRVVETLGLRTGTDNVQVFDVGSVQGTESTCPASPVSGRGSTAQCPGRCDGRVGSGQVRHSGLPAPPVGLRRELTQARTGRGLPGRLCRAGCVLKFRETPPLQHVTFATHHFPLIAIPCFVSAP